MHALRTLTVATLSSCAALVLGCGSSGGPDSSSGSAAAEISHASARTQYAGFAEAVNLRAGDVPGFIAEPQRHKHAHVGNKASVDGGAYRHCFAGVKEAKPVFKRESEQFKSGSGLDTASVSSTVSVTRSVATAEHELAVAVKELGSARARGCLSRVFDQLGTQGQARRVGKGTVRITLGKLGFVPIDVKAATHGTGGGYGFAMHLNIAYHVSGPTRTVTIPDTLQVDALSFLVGRAQVSLGAIALGGIFPSETEAKLFSLLVSRARTASRFYRDLNS